MIEAMQLFLGPVYKERGLPLCYGFPIASGLKLALVYKQISVILRCNCILLLVYYRKLKLPLRGQWSTVNPLLSPPGGAYFLKALLRGGGGAYLI